MSRIDTRIIVLAALASLASAASHAETLVVVESRGIALKPGATVDSGKPLLLKLGQHATLISESGATLVLDGPYDKLPTLEKQAMSLATKLAALTTANEVRTGGTTRGISKAARLPAPWVLDATHPGVACMVEGTTPVFWRPDAGSTQNLVVMPDDRSWRVTTQWRSGVAQLPVTTHVPMHGGATYFIALNGNESAISVTAVPAALINDSMRIAWMADKGCEAQAEALARNETPAHNRK